MAPLVYFRYAGKSHNHLTEWRTFISSREDEKCKEKKEDGEKSERYVSIFKPINYSFSIAADVHDWIATINTENTLIWRWTYVSKMNFCLSCLKTSRSESTIRIHLWASCFESALLWRYDSIICMLCMYFVSLYVCLYCITCTNQWKSNFLKYRQ